MAGEISSEKLSGAINSLLSNPELLQNMMSMLAGASEGSQGATNNGAEHTPAANIEADKSLSIPTSAKVDVTPATDTGGSNPLGNILSDPALMAKLPEVIATISPFISGGIGNKESSHTSSDKQPCPDKRLALLLALKPYLSHERCEAIDYIMKINKLGTLFGSLNR